MTDSRAEFEAWFKDSKVYEIKHELDKTHVGSYVQHSTITAWQAWQHQQSRIEELEARVPWIPEIDELAQFIRQIDGNNSMGAGLLAEHICIWLGVKADQQEDP